MAVDVTRSCPGRPVRVGRAQHPGGLPGRDRPVGACRVEGKRIDYATNGLADYLEIDLLPDPPVVTRYENRDAVLVEVDRAEGDKALVADRPFPYELIPAKLLGR